MFGRLGELSHVVEVAALKFLAVRVPLGRVSSGLGGRTGSCCGVGRSAAWRLLGGVGRRGVARSAARCAQWCSCAEGGESLLDGADVVVALVQVGREIGGRASSFVAESRDDVGGFVLA